MAIYCGNNRLEIGRRRLGTPYECLKKGIGYGLHSDISAFNPQYEPIIPSNIYCGMGDVPEDKEVGTPSACLRKGVGIGKKLQYDRGQSPRQPPPQPPQPMPRHYPQPPQPPQPMPRLKFWWPLILTIFIASLLIYYKRRGLEIVIFSVLTFSVSWLIVSNSDG
jgi:hypothetical protein